MKKPRWLLIAEAITAMLPQLVAVAAIVIETIHSTKEQENEQKSV